MANPPPGFVLNDDGQDGLPPVDPNGPPPGFQLNEPQQAVSPWAQPQQSANGKGIAVFPDEPMPFQGVKPEIERGYMSLATDPKSTAKDLIAFGAANGFQVPADKAEAFIRQRNAGARVGDKPEYFQPPRLLKDSGDGSTGAFMRGVGDPINMLDELGGVVDTLGGTRGRPNIWDNPDQRFGDMLWQNIDANRAILGFDEQNHPYARFGGQVVSGVAVPGASLEGVGLQAARKALQAGSGRFLAEQAARQAVMRRLLLAGTAEGALAGAGAGEGGVAGRLPSAAAGAGIGAVAGPALGIAANGIGSGIRLGRRFLTGRSGAADRAITDVTELAGNAELDNARGAIVPPSGFVLDELPLAEAMRAAKVSAPAPSNFEQRKWGDVMQRSRDVVAGSRAYDPEEVGSLIERLDEVYKAKSAYSAEAETLQDRLMMLERRADDASRPSNDQKPETLRERAQREVESANKAWVDFAYTNDPNSGRFAPPGSQAEREWRAQESRLLAEWKAKDAALVAQMDDDEIERQIAWLARNPVAESDALLANLRGEQVRRGTISRADMAQEGMSPASVSAPAPDDVPEGFVLNEPGLSVRPTPMSERISPEEIARLAEGVTPESMFPRPSNEISSLDEALKANPTPRQLMRAPNERDALPSYRVGAGPARKDPMDLVGFLRSQGGLRDERGYLSRMGVTNDPRNIEFTGSERFLGNLVRDQGMTPDQAAERAWQAGFFEERPSVAEFLDALDATYRGGSGRLFRPDDYPALDAYRSAQRTRNAIEQAEQEGRPMVQDAGRPATMADLDANQPPVTAYEDLPGIIDRVGNIRVDKLGSRQDIAQALKTVSDRFGGFDAARRGRISQGETEALAADLGMTADDLLKRRRGQALNAEQALAARAVLAKSGDELMRLAKAAKGGSDEAVAAFRAGLVRHAAIQEQVEGATAEAGRALAQFRMDAKGELARGRMLKAVLEGGGGRGRIEDIAEKILELDKDPGAANKFARDVLKPGAWAKFQEYWINALLSGPRTHATNIGSNLLTAAMSVPEHALTATIGKITRSADRMAYRDVGARVVGMIEGARDGLRLARRAFMTGEPADGVSQVESQVQRAIPGPIGSIIRTPTRALMAEDEFFKSVAYRGELNALAYREALQRGKNAKERERIFAELRDNPTDLMIDRAVKLARYQTFQAPLKGPGVQLQQLANKGPMKLLIPFVRTPLNLLKYATERSPFAPVLSEFRDAMKAGGMQRDQALARVTMGSGLAALAVSWGLDGRLSGSGPVDPREREALMNTGWQPFSIKVGDKWYSYQRIDPFARVLSTAADFATFGDYMNAKERENVARSISLAVARNISTMPTLDPAASAFEALSDPDRYLERYAKNLAASVAVPNIVTQINSVIDPDMREAETLMETIKQRVPIVSKTLPARVNTWGQPIKRGDALGPDLLSPIWEKRQVKDKTLSEIARLRVGLSKPDRNVGDVRLTPRGYADLVRAGGMPAKSVLDQLTASPGWDRLPDGIKRVMIRRIVEQARSTATRQMLVNNPDLLRAQVMERVNRRLGER